MTDDYFASHAFHASMCETMEMLKMVWCWEYRLIHGEDE